MVDADKKKIEAADTEKTFADFIKDSRKKAALHEYLAIAAKAYIDGLHTALRCQHAAQSAV